MAQCLHVDKNGRPCSSKAEEGASFCRHHSREGAEAVWPGVDPRRLAFRLAALLLLLIFLLPLALQGYRMLRSLLN
jgi:hypothetical protein